MAITIKSVSTGTDNGSTASVSVTTSETPAPTQVGDLVVVIHCNDFRDITNMVAPTATGSPAFTLQGSADGGLNFSHIKVWTYVANTAGAQAITTTETGTHDGDKGLTAYVLGGADTSTPLDGSVVATLSPSTSASSHVLTGVTTASSNSLLFNHLRTSNGAGTASYTAPGSMTLRYDVANFTRFAGGTEQLSASGATGTRTWTPASSVPFVAVAFAIKTAAAGAAPAFIPQSPAKRRPPTPARRRRATPPPPAQVIVPNPNIVQPVVHSRLRFAKVWRGRTAAPVPPQQVPPPAFVPQTLRARVKALAIRRHDVGAPPTDQPAPMQALRPRLKLPRWPRSHLTGPVPPQIVVTPPAYPPANVRTRLRGLRPFRPRAAAPVPAQVTFVAAAYPPQSVRTRLKGLRIFRGHTAAPVPAQVAVVPASYVPQPIRGRLKFLAYRRHGTAPPLTDQGTPPQLELRSRPRFRPIRGHIVTPPQQQPAVPLFTRIRVRLAKIFRGDTRMAAPPQVILIAPPRVAQATKARRSQFAARRHRGGIDGWMVPGVHVCVTPRPSTGTTARPGAGTTAYNLATTARPTTGTATRPNTGITVDPC